MQLADWILPLLLLVTNDAHDRTQALVASPAPLAAPDSQPPIPLPLPLR